MPSSTGKTSQYEASGVSQSGAESALDGLLKHVLPTRKFSERYPLKADIGYFANVIDIGNGEGIAFCTDGVRQGHTWDGNALEPELAAALGRTGFGLGQRHRRFDIRLGDSPELISRCNYHDILEDH